LNHEGRVAKSNACVLDVACQRRSIPEEKKKSKQSQKRLVHMKMRPIKETFTNETRRDAESNAREVCQRHGMPIRVGFCVFFQSVCQQRHSIPKDEKKSQKSKETCAHEDETYKGDVYK